jgi:broad specificity phosphatase PhoE
VPGPCYLITHPEVAVDPGTPVVDWSLSPAGRARAERLTALPWVRDLERLVCSSERKARETADVLGAATGLTCLVDDELGENDRTATGFLPPAEFEAVADAFFAAPTESVRGWETAAAAQGRVVHAVRRHLAVGRSGVAFVAHGAVGTLLYCDLAGVAVDRRHDQPGQGSYYAFDPVRWRPLHPWRRLP